MAYNVTNWFHEKSMSKSPKNIIKRFTIGSSDYSSSVIRWPTIKTSWDKVRETKLTMPMVNEDGRMNFIKDDKTKMREDCAIEFGFSNNNILYYSQELDNTSVWTTGGAATVTADTDAAPDGTTTADTIDDASAIASGYVVQIISNLYNDGEIYTGAVFIKKDATGRATRFPVVRLGFQGVGTHYIDLAVDTNTGDSDESITSFIENNSSNVEDYDDDYWRVTLTASNNLGLHDEVYILIFPAAGASSTWVKSVATTGSIIAWGAQIEESSTVSDYGATIDTQLEETIELFSGKMSNVSYKKGACNISIVDKFKQLSERVIGTSENPVAVTGNELVSNIAWWAVTSYGGLSSVQSTSNPDINYSSFLDWAAVFSGDSVYMNTNFDGVKVTEVLRKLSKQTLSAIYIQENKLTFNRFSVADANISSLDNSTIIDLELSFDDKDTVNKQYVFADYDTTSKYFTTTVHDTDSASVNSFGLREETEKDKELWYVGSGSALNMAQRITAVHGTPYDKFDAEVPAVGMLHQIGETISITDAQLSETTSFRGLHKTINLNDLKIVLSGDKSQLEDAFILDVTSLDGTEVLV